MDHPLVGKIWDVAHRRFATREEVWARAAATRYVLLGENHDNPDHHRLQAATIEALAAERAPAVVLEMIDRSLQPAVDEALRAAPDDVDGFGKAIAWKQSGWPEWAIYRPIFAAALGRRLRVVGANLPRSEAMGIARGTASLPAALVSRYKLDTPLPEALHADLLAELHESHCGHMPAQMIEPMVGIQRARDALMADALATAADASNGAGTAAILIAGNGHVRKDRGVPWYLGADALAISFVEVYDERTEPAAYGERYGGTPPFDYLWFTPRANDIDHCEELRKTMQQHKHQHKPAGEHKPAAGSPVRAP